MDMEEMDGAGEHLREVFELYEKVREFDRLELASDYGSLEHSHVCYVEEDIDTVMDRFAEVFGVAEEQIVPVKDAMRSGIIDLTLLTQGEVESSATPILGGEMLPLLYVISRPYFRSVRSGIEVDNIYWEEGRCPVCNAVPVLSMIDPGEKRRYRCSFCGTVGYFKRIGCPCCQNEDPDSIDLIYVEDELDARLDLCLKCSSYFKTVESRVLSSMGPEYFDLLSLPLDVIAQNRGFMRRSPNPIGLVSLA